MTIEKNQVEEKLTMKVIGRLDSTTAPELEEAVKESIEGVKDFCFDLSELEYISSAGLRVLLLSQKIMSKQGDLKVTNVKDEVMEIFEVTGFSEILTIE